MGNYISCAFIAPVVKTMKSARVVFPGGEVRQFHEQIKAAELMLECPSHFIVNSRSLNIGRRFSPLAADEDLEFGDVYITFPMRRLNSMITAADVAVLFVAAKRISGGKLSALSPEVVAAAAAVDGLPESENGRPRLSLDEVEIEGTPVSELRYRLSVCRSKKPMLDTITEEPLCFR